ncbi:MAG: hypothetical protein VYC19_11385 [Pseudomonadota bacterium]|nr:hypothetical protein [Pseudomonadota bacterium]MEC7703345.1 hypothetical protein [Pseudomonadota bacterium]MEC9235628.1 hypothetical protein [Pseudomonadota bacterium]
MNKLATKIFTNMLLLTAVLIPNMDGHAPSLNCDDSHSSELTTDKHGQGCGCSSCHTQIIK